MLLSIVSLKALPISFLKMKLFALILVSGLLSLSYAKYNYAAARRRRNNYIQMVQSYEKLCGKDVYPLTYTTRKLDCGEIKEYNTLILKYREDGKKDPIGFVLLTIGFGLLLAMFCIGVCGF